MKDIVPAVIPDSLEDLRVILEVTGSFTKNVQIDIVDGKFVPFTSWPYNEGDSIKDLTEFTEAFTAELDLMIENPEDTLREYVDAGIKRAVVHIESTDKLDEIVALRREKDFRLGLSINNDTELSVLREHIASADYAQLMGIAKIGSQGQSFDERVLERIKELKDQYPELEISIDGSVNEETIKALRDAGADRFISGSAILGADDPKVAYETLMRIANE